MSTVITDVRGLQSFMSQYGEITEDQFAEIAPLFEVVRLKKGEYLLKEGEVCDFLCFITSGFMRMFVNSMDHVESTIHISSTGSFITNYASYATCRPSWVFLQAVTEVDLLLVRKVEVDKVWARSHFWESICRRIMEHHLVWLEDRLVASLRLTAEQRYLMLMEDSPEVLQNVPLQYIATYLGVKPETLSRIRARIS